MFNKPEVTRRDVIVRIRQMCQAGQRNLDAGYKPDVVCKKFNGARDVLKKEIQEVRNFRTQLELQAILSNVGDIPPIARVDSYYLRGWLGRVDTFLPSVVKK